MRRTIFARTKLLLTVFFGLLLLFIAQQAVHSKQVKEALSPEVKKMKELMRTIPPSDEAMQQFNQSTEIQISGDSAKEVDASEDATSAASKKAQNSQQVQKPKDQMQSQDTQQVTKPEDQTQSQDTQQVKKPEDQTQSQDTQQVKKPEDQTQSQDNQQVKKPDEPAQTQGEGTAKKLDEKLKAAAIGDVLIVKGPFKAVDKDKKERDLKRRSLFFIGDTLVTGEKARAQIHFLDDTIIALRPNTEFRVDEFIFEKKDTDKHETYLLKGGFRAITGIISKKKPKNFKVTTPVAVIGVRGTEFTAVLADEELFVSVWRGKLEITTEMAALIIGEDEVYKNAMIHTKTEAPKGLADVPPQISFCPYETQRGVRRPGKRKKPR